MLTDDREIISRKEAKIAGLTQYFTGKPCKYGHVHTRKVTNGGCVECHRLRSNSAYHEDIDVQRASRRLSSKKYRERNPEKGVAYAKLYYERNTEVCNSRRKVYYQANKQRLLPQKKAKDRLYYENNKEDFLIRNRNRRAAKLERVPSWYGESDKRHMTFLTRECKRLKDLTGIRFHIDHIIPMRGDTVSGLHCKENWQILTAHDNLSKSNNYPNAYSGMLSPEKET